MRMTTMQKSSKDNSPVTSNFASPPPQQQQQQINKQHQQQQTNKQQHQTIKQHHPPPASTPQLQSTSMANHPHQPITLDPQPSSSSSPLPSYHPSSTRPLHLRHPHSQLSSRSSDPPPSRPSLKSARDADVLGKILGWRQSKHLRITSPPPSSSILNPPSSAPTSHLPPQSPHAILQPAAPHLIRPLPSRPLLNADPPSPQRLPAIFRSNKPSNPSSFLDSSHQDTQPSSSTVHRPDQDQDPSSSNHHHHQDHPDENHKPPEDRNSSIPLIPHPSRLLPPRLSSNLSSLNPPPPHPESSSSNHQSHPSIIRSISSATSVLISGSPPSLESDPLPSSTRPEPSIDPSPFKPPIDRPPILKKSLSSDHLNLLLTQPLISKLLSSPPCLIHHLSSDPPPPSSLTQPLRSDLQHHPEPINPTPPSFLESRTAHPPNPSSISSSNPPSARSVPKDLNAPRSTSRFSLPSLHAILDPHRSQSQTAPLDRLTHSDHSLTQPILPSILNHRPVMHGVASNESIRTARPDLHLEITDSTFQSLDDPTDLTSDSHLDRPSTQFLPHRSRRFRNPRVFDLFIDTSRREPLDLVRRFLSPDLVGSSSPSETSSNPSQSHSLGLSIHSSQNPLNHLSNLTHPYSSSFNRDPRFVIWAQTPHSSLPPPVASNIHTSSKKRSSLSVETHHYHHHPASASTSHLGIDQSTGRLTHAPRHHHHHHPPPPPLPPSHPPSFNFSSPSHSTHPKRWSRTTKASITSAHYSPHDLLSNSSPVPSNDSHHSRSSFGRSREDHRHPHSTEDHHLLSKISPHRILMAATLERWIAELTTNIDSIGLKEFFFTYRSVIKPNDLVQLLASRFEWSIMFRSRSYARHLPEWSLSAFLINPNLEKGILALDGRLLGLDQENETLRRVAKVRTFVMIRHWLVNHFEDDFLNNVPLQLELHDWLENLTEKIKRLQRLINRLDDQPTGYSSSDQSKNLHPIPYHPQDLNTAVITLTSMSDSKLSSSASSYGGEDDLRILKNLRKILKEQQTTHHQSFNVVARTRPDSTNQTNDEPDDSNVVVGHLNHKQPKADVRELFKDPEPIKMTTKDDLELRSSNLRRTHRSHTADLIHVPKSISKTALRHGRFHSINSLAQVRAANYAKSDLRLSETENDATNTEELLGDDIHDSRKSVDETSRSEQNRKLISKLESVFRSDTRRSRNGVTNQAKNYEFRLDSTRYSSNQANSSLPPIRNPSQLILTRFRPSDIYPDTSKSLTNPQPRLNLSNSPPIQFQSGLNFPQHHNPLHRYFTSTMGTLGRFKRMINNRSGTHATFSPVLNHHQLLGTRVSASESTSSPLSREPGSQQDSDQNEIGDLLCVKSGLEKYLSFFEIQKDSSMSTYEEEAVKVDPVPPHDISNLSSLPAESESKSSFESGSFDDLNNRPPSGSPAVRYDDRFDSQLSLSSSLTTSTSTTRSIPCETDGELDGTVSRAEPLVVSVEGFGESHELDQSTPSDDPHPLHGSMSIETIKSESHHLSLAGGGMKLLKKQLRKKLTHNKDMCPILMRSSMDESFSNSLPDRDSTPIRYSQDHLPPRSVNMPSGFLSIPGDRHDGGEDRPRSVQLDEIDAFESEDEFPVGGGPKLRRLPGAVDLKQAIAFSRKSLFNLKGSFLKANEDRSKRFSSETSSSIGTRRVPSIAASMFRRSKLSYRSSVLALDTSSCTLSTQESYTTESGDNENGGPGVVANFVADGLESDDDEPGDVEAALRRLEGVIDADREKEKARRVELQMMKSMEASRRTRSRSGGLSDERNSYHSEMDDTDELETCSESIQEEEERSEISDDDDDDDDDVDEEEEEEEDEENDEEEDEDENNGIEKDEDEEDSGADEKGRNGGVQLASDHPVSRFSLPVKNQGRQDSQLLRSSPPSLILTNNTSHDLIMNPPDITEASQLSSNQNLTTTTSSSRLTPALKPHLRFFTSPSKGTSSVDDERGSTTPGEDSSKTLRGNGQRSRDNQVMARKGSLHKLFSASNPPRSNTFMGYKKPHRARINLPPPTSSTTTTPRSTVTTPRPTMLTTIPLPPVHRSFLLDCRTEILAQQFCLIERDLLRKITWQELLLSKWQENRSTLNNGSLSKSVIGGPRKKRTVMVEDSVTCWESFMKQRAKEKMQMKGRINETIHHHHHHSQASPSFTEGNGSGTEINALIMRFNLTCNWVASELVLTLNLEERVSLLGKFIRLAFKCYRQNNFQTLTQIIHGLQTPYVARLKKTWSKLGIWESRMFRDLKEFTSHLSNFKSLRNVQDSLINDSSSSTEPSNLNNNNAQLNPTIATNNASLTATISSSTTSPSANHNPALTSHSYLQSDFSATHHVKANLIPSRGSSSTNACIPFLGLYLRDLTINDELPTYLDPTDPSTPVEIDESTGRLKQLSNPKVFENLPKLPKINGDGDGDDDDDDDDDEGIVGAGNSGRRGKKKKVFGKEGFPEDERAGRSLDQEEVEDEGVYYPLININKLRIYSKIVFKIIEFQDRSIKNYNFDTDSKWFLTCLKIKCLNSEQLRKLSIACEP